MGNPPTPFSRLLRRQYFLPSEHGAWIWWIGPLLVGSAAAGAWPADATLLVAAAFAGFLLRQPATIAVKAARGRRPRSDLSPALVWIAIDLWVMSLASAGLVRHGHIQILALALPGLLVFLWHLYLVGRREERGQMGVELVGAGALALAAPAAYWVAEGSDNRLAWILWLLCWLQSAASIVLVYFRLGYRKLPAMPPVEDRIRAGRRTLLYHAFNSILACGLALAGLIPELMASAFLLMLLDAIGSVARPPVGQPPTRIGLHQLGLSSLFVVLSAVGFLA